MKRKIGFFTLVTVLLHFPILRLNANIAAPDKYSLQDEAGRSISISAYKGKILVIDFWFTGCVNCMGFYQGSLSNAEQHFSPNPDVVFISICIDKDRTTWLRSLEKGKYASKESVNLYTGGLGDKHALIKKYKVVAYPQPVIIGKNGEAISESIGLIHPDTLIKTIETALK